MTDPTSAHIEALRRELAGYLATGRNDRAAAVEAELARLGATDPAPAKAPTAAPDAATDETTGGESDSPKRARRRAG